MGDFFVDDQFYDHPKALQAGEDAANLYIRGLAWAHRHNTALIPKNALPALTTKRNTAALAAKLGEVRLWHDEGSHYRIHDWETRNAKSVAKREQARTAAKERWRQHSDRNADPPETGTRTFHNGITTTAGTLPAVPNGQPPGPVHAQTAKPQVNDEQGCADAEDPHERQHSVRNADPLPYQPRNQGTKEPRTFALGVTGNSRRLPETADDDEPSPQNTTAAALLILAERSLKAREAEKGPVADRKAWLAVAVQRRAVLHAATIADTHAKRTWRPEQLADHLEPPKTEPAHPQTPRTVRCVTCSDRPHVYDIDEHGNAVACPDCLPAGEPA